MALSTRMMILLGVVGTVIAYFVYRFFKNRKAKKKKSEESKKLSEEKTEEESSKKKKSDKKKKGGKKKKSNEEKITESFLTSANIISSKIVSTVKANRSKRIDMITHLVGHANEKQMRKQIENHTDRVLSDNDIENKTADVLETFVKIIETAIAIDKKIGIESAEISGNVDQQLTDTLADSTANLRDWEPKFDTDLKNKTAKIRYEAETTQIWLKEINNWHNLLKKKLSELQQRLNKLPKKT